MIEQYTLWLSALSRWLTPPLGGLADQVNVPLVSALVFGLLGAFAPCQLSTGLAALGYLARRAAEPRRLWAHTLAYLAGRATVYLLLGGGLALAGLGLGDIAGTAVPLAALERKLFGPLLIGAGLVLGGWLRLRLSVGGRLTHRFQRLASSHTGAGSAYLMGVAFAFTFCPTLFWLFFGLTLPLAVATPGGVMLPGVFAIGTGLPLLAFTALFTLSGINVRALVGRFQSLDRWAQRVAGLVFVLVGMNEVVLYWLL